MVADDTLNAMSRSLALMNRFIADELHAHGLGGIVPSHGGILVELFKQDELPMGEIAARIAREPSTTTVLVRKLEESGYVALRKDPADKRVVLVSLTERGRALQPVFQRISDQLFEIAQKDISDGDWQVMRQTLRQVQRNFGATS